MRAALWVCSLTLVTLGGAVSAVAQAPHLASATVALNTSSIYVGQAIGSASGGFLYDRALYHAGGYLSVTLFILAMGLFALTEWRRV